MFYQELNIFLVSSFNSEEQGTPTSILHVTGYTSKNQLSWNCACDISDLLSLDIDIGFGLCHKILD